MNLSDVTTGLFGGSNANSNSFVNPQQTPYLGDIYGKAQSLYNQGLLGQVAPLNYLQKAGLTSGENFASNFDPSSAYGALNTAFNAPNLQNNPYIHDYTNAAIQPMVDQFQQSILPSIMNNTALTRSGSRGSIAAGLAAKGLLQNIGRTTSDIYNNAYNTGMGSMLQGLNLAPSTYNLGLMPSNALMNLGGTLQSQQQNELNAPYSGLSQYQSLIGTPTVLNNYTASNSPGLLGGAGQFMRNVFG